MMDLLISEQLKNMEIEFSVCRIVHGNHLWSCIRDRHHMARLSWQLGQALMWFTELHAKHSRLHLIQDFSISVS